MTGNGSQNCPNASTIDPVTANVIQGALENIAVEMGYKLMRMSYSSIIRESEDFGAAIIDTEGRQLCESKQSTPLQSGPIPGYVKGMHQLFEERGDTLNPGDVIIHNSAYHGASHGPDVAFIVPVFVDGDTLVGYSVTTAHHLDIGALSPGSCGIVDAMDAYAEGLQFKALKAYDKGIKNEALWCILRDNIRASDLVVGDMEAQVAASRIGAERFLELIERYDLATVQAGTADQCNDRPINMPLEGTVDCAIWLTLRSILLDSAVYGHIPQNSGLVRPIKIEAPEGCLANPIFPAPTIARFAPGNIVADTLMKALPEAVPTKVGAGVGNLKVVAFSGIKGEQHWVHMEIHEGSYGGRYGKDGMDAVDTLYANTRNNPIEDIESHTPLRVTRYELRDDSAAAGRWRGGIGSIREVEFLEDSFISVEGDGHKFAPWGYDGGSDGNTANLEYLDGTGMREGLPSMMPNRAVRAGESLALTGTCGGGYGDPMTRPEVEVLEDVLDGYISVERAQEGYGVVITPTMDVDSAATAARRSAGAK